MLKINTSVRSTFDESSEQHGVKVIRSLLISIVDGDQVSVLVDAECL